MQGEFIVAATDLNDFASSYKQALLNMGFKIEKESQEGVVLKIKAVEGPSKLKAVLLRGLAKHASQFREANRTGAEAEMYAGSKGIVLKLNVVPYMAFANSKDIFLVTQGIGERYLADKPMVRDKFNQIISALMSRFQISQVSVKE